MASNGEYIGGGVTRNASGVVASGDQFDGAAGTYVQFGTASRPVNNFT